MRAKTLLVVILASSVLCGCIVQSLHPFCPEEAGVEVPQLTGVWMPVAEEGKEGTATPWIFGTDTITTHDENGKPGKLDVIYFRAGETLFVDATAADPDDQGINEWWAVHVAPIHTVSKVVLEGDKVSFRPLRYDWLKKAVDGKKVALPHVLVDRDGGHVVYTATPEQWMEFLKEHGTDDGAFSTEDSLEFTRLVEKKAAAPEGE